MTVERRFPPSVQPGKPKLGDLHPGWKRFRIGDFFEVQNRPVALQDDKQYDLVTVRRSRGGVDFRSRLFGREISVKSQFYIREGDFLISKRQIVHGACGFVPAELDGAIVSNEYSVLRCTNIVDPSYLNQLIHSVYLQQTFFHSSIGVHIEKMIFKLEDWFKWPVRLPPISEQKKISAFLDAVDNKAKSFGVKKDFLEAFKKGCMQRLFSREIRFKDDHGCEFPDWKNTHLNAIADVNPVTPSLPDFFKYIDLESVSGGVLSDPKDVSKSDAPSRAQRVLAKDDILFQMVRPYQRNNLHFRLDGSYVASTGYAQLRSHMSADFLFQLIQTDRFVGDVLARCTGTSYPAINSKDLASIAVSIPDSEEEQMKIGGYLAALDRKIELTAKEIADVERFKKGLLQQMFV